MPKIDAPTVAEHRALREKAVITAAVGILVTEGTQAVTPGAVASEAGIARTSIYQYYPSTGALLGSAIEALSAQREQRLRAALEDCGDDPRERIAAYVRTVIQLAHDATPPSGEIDIVPEDIRKRLREAEARIQQPLRDAIRELGVQDAATVTALVEGTLRTAGSLAEEASSIEELAQAGCAFVMAGVDAMAQAA